MSTRCQIGFYKKKEEDLNKWEALLYKHSDGYPDTEHGVIETITPILTSFNKERGLDDIEYASAWLVAKLKADYLNIGICNSLHGDIEFYYAVYPDKISVFEVSEGAMNAWKEIQTVKL